MRKSALLSLASLMLVGGVIVGPASLATGQGTPKILEFDTMVGVPRPYTGATNAIRDGTPWRR